MGDSRFDDFTSLEYGVGYQIYCSSCTPGNPVTVSITGKVPTQQQTQSLAPGWHLLPAITTGSQALTVAQVFANLAYDAVLRYNPANGSLTSLLGSDPVEAGAAYYVRVIGTNPSTWTPPLPQDVTTRFVYDGDGGRVKQITPSGTTKYLGESYEIAPDGVVTKYIFAGSQRIAAVAQSPQPGAPSLRYYHTDHLGSSNVITDGTGAVAQQLDYTPYGSVHTNTGSVNVSHQFTGQRLDPSTGLYFYNARYYDPQLGRFVQADTVVPSPGDPQALNRYSYVRNNPLKYVDPSGHFFWFIPMLIGALLGGLLGGIMAAINGQNFFKGFLVGAVSGAILGGYGAIAAHMFSGATVGAIMAKTMTMAMAGAIAGTASAAVGGGSLGQGAAFGALGAATFTAIGALPLPDNVWGAAAGIGLSAAAGGGISELAGGDFWQGALVAGTIQSLSTAAGAMRRAMIAQSKLNPKNASGSSAGHKGDAFKLGGGRYNPANPNAPPSPLGGTQGGPGKMFGLPYKPGSLQDTIVEAYAGPHDYLNSWFGYDASGNIQQGMSGLQQGVGGIMNAVNVAIATPFAAASLPPMGATMIVDYSKFTTE